MELSKTEKFRAINYIKAITIILVVASHYTSSPLNQLAPYMYHMPLFFFLGGMLFNHEKSLKDHYSKVFFKHFTYIIITYIVVGIIATLINKYTNAPTGVIFTESVWSTVIKTIYDGFSNNRYFLASWFLFTYMVIMIFAPFICRVIHKLQFPVAIGILLSLAIGWVGIEITSVIYHKTKNITFNYITQILVGGMFFILGFSLKNYIFRLMHEVIFSLVILLTIILYGKHVIYVIGISWSVYKLDFMSSLIGAILGIYCIVYISASLSRVISFKWLEFIGEGSKDIMSYHLVAFSLLNIFAWKYYNFDISKNDILHSFSSEWSWIPYMIFGVSLPLIITVIYNKYLKIYIKKLIP